MNKKLLNLLLMISFHFGYLEWGQKNSMFIFQVEKDIFSKAVSDWKGIIHPFIIIPFAGIILLAITLFQSVPSRELTIAGLSCLSLLMLFIFLIGILGLNYKILLSSIPFLVIATLILINLKNKRPGKVQHS